MANPSAGFVARAMCALAAASLIAAPVIVNADAGAPTKHKVHKRSTKCPAGKRYSKKRHRCVAVAWKGQRNAGALPRNTTVTTSNATPAAPAAPQTYAPYTPPQTVATTPPAQPVSTPPAPATAAGAVAGGAGTSIGVAVGLTAAAFALGGAIGSGHSPGG
ncbi:MAG: hypothetical protein WCL10_12905 [Novosphingobium sp.]|uniref:hypothetical protein n=1 Tax=Novosphingobium sp. TaxID=1874826 RepID=UPI0030190A14